MVTYEEALSTLVAMFGPQWSHEDLDTVLRHFEGHMENTVDSILSHGDKRPRVLIDQLNKAQTGFDLDEQLAREMTQEEENRFNRSSATIPPALRRGPTTETLPRQAKAELPQDFLRIPGYPYPDTSSTFADDEALAMALQNELFMKQIRNDPELAHLSGPRFSNTTAPAARQGNPFPSFSRQGAGTHDGPGFMEALSELGDNAKKKLQVLAQKFNANILKPNLSQGSGGIGGRSGADEGRGLLQPNEEEVFFSEGDTEMKAMSANRPLSRRID